MVNFKQKEVNPDSPYQKEKERTVQFKAQKGGSLSNTASFSGSGTAESSFAQRNPGTVSSPAPTAETLREEMLRKTSATERTATYSKPESTVSDKPSDMSVDDLLKIIEEEKKKY